MDSFVRPTSSLPGSSFGGESDLSRLLAERAEARRAFQNQRHRRDGAAAYYDSVVYEDTTLTKPAWDAYRDAQEAMDLAGDRLIALQATIADLTRR
ncbi:MAG: hypothetical protein WCK73_09335 [Deltaproteobacteria bacterium]